MNERVYFNNNEGLGGFQQGAYDKMAIHPVNTNWTRKSRYKMPDNPKLLWKVSIDNAYVDNGIVNAGFVIDRDNNIIIVDGDNQI